MTVAPDGYGSRTRYGLGPVQGDLPSGARPARSLPNATFPATGGRGFGAGLFPFRSPLLGESRLVSFPPLIYMLKFGGSSRLI